MRRIDSAKRLATLICRILVLCLRRLIRSSKSWDSRVLFISDSMVAIGCLAKGRSPSWVLLRLARMAAAVVLTCGLKPYYRYVQSKRNHADGPSRGFPVGVAPEWATEKEKDPQWVAMWERSQQNKATIEMRRSNRMAPAAYRGPRGVLLQRAFRCSNPWGKETGEQIYMHDMEW